MMVGGEAEPQRASAAKEVNPVQVLHKALRGRYPLVITFVVVLAAIGGALGWRMTKQLYRSDGLIEIKYAQPAVDPSVAQSGPTPFQVFIDSQRTLITSRRVVDRALTDSAWKSIGRPLTPQTANQFIKNLDVVAEKGTEYLRITFTDTDPLAAAAAVKAVTNAYLEVYKDDEQHLESTRLRLLKQTRKDLTERVKAMQAEMDQTVKQFGSADLAFLQSAAVMRTTRLDSAIDDVHLMMASAPAQAPARADVPATQPAAPARRLTPREIAQSDAAMRGFLDEEAKLEEELQLLRVQGYGDSFPRVFQLKFRIERLGERIGQYADEYITVQRAIGRPVSDPVTGTILAPIKSMAELRIEEEHLTTLREKARAEMADVAAEYVRQTRRDAELKRDREALDIISRKIDQLEDQEQMGGRLTVISAGEIPLSPELDRRMKFAAAAAGGGALLPVLIFGLVGFVWQRYQYADETASDLSSSVPLLGILPSLGEPLEHADAMLAAQRVHQIRVMLQVGRPTRQAYLVTSASAGEGKTSLAMALGLSFAATGIRTLLIDGDLVGRQVTRGMEANGLPGLSEALRSGSLRGFLRRTAAGLCVLPVGRADPHDGFAVSPDAFRRLMVEARQYFDTIVVDSGPVLGSVEASILAQDVDGVLLTVSHGQQPPLVQRTMKHLGSLGATVCGFVFNRALSRDFYGSYYGSSSGSASGRMIAQTGAIQRRCRFGPLVAAVLSSLPHCVEPSFS